MPYYGTGDYYGQGDPGLLGIIGAGVSVVRGVRRAIRRGRTPRSRRAPGRSIALPFAPPTMGPAPRGGGKKAAGTGRRRRRRNNMNPKALRRASARIDGFVKEAKKALKHTNYKLVTKSSGRGKTRGVITRAEAERALRN